MSNTERGRPVEIHPRMWHQLIEKCEAAFDGNQKAAGEELARKVGRTAPFSGATMSRFWNKSKIAEPLLRALCAYFDMPYPIIKAPVPELARWYDLGERLRAKSKPEFRELLKSAERRLQLLELRDKYPDEH